MSMRKQATRDWCEPLALAKAVEESGEEHWAFLYTSLINETNGRYSYLAYQAQDQIKTDRWDDIAPLLESQKNPFNKAWFGYLGYDMKNDCESLPYDEPASIDWPDSWLIRYGVILVFDHITRRIDIWAESASLAETVPDPAPTISTVPFKVDGDLSSNMSTKDYLQHVDTIKRHIYRGDVYQANLTRKFFGRIEREHSLIDHFAMLCKISPSPFSACMRFGDRAVLSSSPELFLSIDGKGNVETRPIKGTYARGDSPENDAMHKNALAHSSKDRAENLMIVDLCRNDLSRDCIAGSVTVEKLFNIETYPNVFHMVSNIAGVKRQESTTLDIIQHCFPPGSMTGAPKIKAIEICSAIEKQRRNVYAGALGWIGGDGSATLSVVIRTLLLHDSLFEFQVGGAVVADSVPEMELKEICDKAMGLCHLLGLTPEHIIAAEPEIVEVLLA